VEKTKKRSEASTERTKVWWSFITTALGVIGALFSTLASVSALLKIPDILVGFVGSLVAGVVTAAFTAILARRERGPSRLAKVKDELTGAYLSALGDSPLNPAQGGQP
jgi:hypothetical protein